jgi:hypothetical protein
MTMLANMLRNIGQRQILGDFAQLHSRKCLSELFKKWIFSDPEDPKKSQSDLDLLS